MAETPMERGLALVRRLFGAAAGQTPLPADFGRITVEHVFGNVWSRPGLALEERSLATLRGARATASRAGDAAASRAASRRRAKQVVVALAREGEQRLHSRGARNLGIPRAKLEELITHVAHYAGWPVAVSAFRVLDEVWRAMDQEAAK